MTETTSQKKLARQRCETCGRSRYVRRRWCDETKRELLAECTACGARWPTKRTASALKEANENPPLDAPATTEFAERCGRCESGTPYSFHAVENVAPEELLYRLCHGCGALEAAEAHPLHVAVARHLPLLTREEVDALVVQPSKLRCWLERGLPASDPVGDARLNQAAHERAQAALADSRARRARQRDESSTAVAAETVNPTDTAEEAERLKPAPDVVPVEPRRLSPAEQARVDAELELAERDALAHALRDVVERVLARYDETALRLAAERDTREPGDVAVELERVEREVARTVEEGELELRVADRAQALEAAKLTRAIEREAEHERRRLAAARERVKRRATWATTLLKRALEDWARNEPRDTKTAIRLPEGARLQWRRSRAGWRVRDDVTVREIVEDVVRAVGELEAVERGLLRYELVPDKAAILAAVEAGAVEGLRCVEHRDEQEKLVIYGV